MFVHGWSCLPSSTLFVIVLAGSALPLFGLATVGLVLLRLDSSSTGLKVLRSLIVVTLGGIVSHLLTFVAANCILRLLGALGSPVS